MSRVEGEESRGIDPIVREAFAEDFVDIREMDQTGRRHIASQRGGEGWIAEHPPIDELMNNSDYRILVADLLDEVVGYSISSDEIDPQRGRICRIERVFVHDEAREIGCGDLLLAAEISRAQERRCVLIEGDALPGDRETKNLYERAGITARRITVSKRLNDPSTEEPSSR